MSPVRVVVNGALGKMGQAVLAALAADESTVLVAGIDSAASTETVQVPGYDTVPLASSADRLPSSAEPDVMIDFSTADATLPVVRWAAERGSNFVVGTTGQSQEAIDEMRGLAQRCEVGGVVAPNFALGAVVMMDVARRASRHFDYAEIIETHHETKIDAPSGTAVATARMLAEARGRPFERNVPERETVQGPRGASVEGVTVHSVRLPGAMAHQEVIFGTAGQTLSIRHDTINRDCYGPGILIAVRHVMKHKGFVYGLDNLLGLGG